MAKLESRARYDLVVVIQTDSDGAASASSELCAWWRLRELRLDESERTGASSSSSSTATGKAAAPCAAPVEERAAGGGPTARPPPASVADGTAMGTAGSASTSPGASSSSSSFSSTSSTRTRDARGGTSAAATEFVVLQPVADVAACQVSGVDHCLSMPLSVQCLAAVLKAWLERRR